MYFCSVEKSERKIFSIINLNYGKMKKLFLMGFVALGLASCVSDKEVAPQTQDQKYQAAFENLVGGKINASVNWGFNDQQVAVFDADGNFTGMRGEYANANEWSSNMDVPAAPTAEEIELVTKYFTDNQKPDGVSVNWSDFFVWDISSQGYGKTNMDQLKCGPDKENLEHMNNFNAGTCSDNGYHGRSMCMQNTGTAEFTFECSLDDTRHAYYDHFVIIPGSVIDPSLEGNYYVGFDFESDGTTAEKKIARDYFFNDWIIRINPGLYKGQRVMVEDLIASDLSQVGYTNGKSDWDFNDAVFDVYFTSEWDNNISSSVDYAVVTLWAAGGTKALTIGGKEVHELFGKSVSTMINTNATGGVDGLAPVIFRIKNPGTRNANDIVVKVGGTELTAETGKAPQKVEVSRSTRWMKEMMIITSSYADFATYATTASPTNWYENASNTGNLY